MEEDDALIPCEHCEVMIRFSQYESHIRGCGQPALAVSPFFLNQNDFPLLHEPEQLHPIANIIPFLAPAPWPPQSNEPAPVPAWVQRIAHLFQPTNAPHPFELLENTMDEYEMNTMLTELMGGNVYVGVQDISKVITKVESTSKLPPDNTLCAICQECLREKMEEQRGVCKTLCNHYFCNDCILQWLGTSKKCPICMTELES